MKRVVVTGAAGFIGKRLTTLLNQRGFEVVGIDIRPPSGREPLDKAHIVQADLRDPRAYSEHLNEVGAVIHTAAYIPSNQTDPREAEECFKVNSLATLTLLQECELRGVRRVVYLSTAAVYSGLSPQTAVSEDAPVCPVGHGCFYATSKLAGEFFVQHFHRRGAFSAACLRLGSVYGFGMKPGAVVARFMSAAANGEPLRVMDGGRAFFDYVHVDDVVEAVTRCISGDCTGVINVGSGRVTTVLELARTVVEIFPERSLKVVVEPAASTEPPGLPPLDLARATHCLGFRPRSLKDGLMAYKREMEQHAA